MGNRSTKQTQPAYARRDTFHMLRFVFALCAIFAALQTAWLLARAGWLEHFVIDRLVVAPSAVLINWMTPAERVVASGHHLSGRVVHLSVLGGCEGTDVVLLLWAAILAAPLRARAKVYGMVLGSVFVYALNQGRIVALYHAARLDKSWFDMLHGYIAPTVVIVAGSLFYLAWLMTWQRDATGPH